jgi:hypothetical protein
MKTISTIIFLCCLFSSTAFAQLPKTQTPLTTDALLDTIEHTAFNFFWNQANPANGLIRDRANVNGTSSAACSIASVGFGLSAICIGVDHGWVSRTAARDRVLTTLKTFWYSPQGYNITGDIGNFGLFYHFLDMNTATRDGDSELSTIDTALLLAGIIDARQYFSGSDSTETLIRQLADSIYYRMNWNLMRSGNPGIYMGWKPGTGFTGYGQWVGYNEASIMYILALGSPTHPVDYTAWQEWTSGYQYGTQYGYTYVIFPPLFGHQYSQCWIDYRAIADDYMKNHNLNYFENSRRATLAQRAYAIANPRGFAGYSDSLWGFTASDTPYGYKARGAPPAQDDDGTITPTAPVSSIAFAPEVVIPVIYKMWNTYGSQLWTQFGFRDAFNLSLNWWDTDVIGIDQGPMIIMIENYRTQRVWNRFMQNPDIQRGLQAAKFTTISDVKQAKILPKNFSLYQNFPNPFNPTTLITYQLPKKSFVRLEVYNLLGTKIATLVNETQDAGTYNAVFAGSEYNLASGIYFYKLSTGNFIAVKKMTYLK